MVDLIPILRTEINTNQPTNQGSGSSREQPHQLYRQASIPGSVYYSILRCFLVQEHQSWIPCYWPGAAGRRGGGI
jgi:hypothetical protein